MRTLPHLSSSPASLSLVRVWSDNLAVVFILTTRRCKVGAMTEILRKISRLEVENHFRIFPHFHYRTQLLARAPDLLSNVLFPLPSQRGLGQVAASFGLSHRDLDLVFEDKNLFDTSTILQRVHSSTKRAVVVALPLGLPPRVLDRFLPLLVDFAAKPVIWQVPNHPSSAWFRKFFASRPLKVLPLNVLSLWEHKGRCLPFCQTRSVAFCLTGTL